MMAKQFQMSSTEWNALFGCKAKYESCKTQGERLPIWKNATNLGVIIIIQARCKMILTWNYKSLSIPSFAWFSELFTTVVQGQLQHMSVK